MPTDAQPNPSTAKPKRRWWQYSISSLLGLVLVVTVPLAFVVNPARKQCQAVEYVESLGGGVEYADETDEGRFRAPDWLRAAIGEHYFRTVEGVGLNDSRVSNAGLAHIGDLRALEWLYLEKTNVSDAGLAHLKKLTTLRVLDLSQTQISDAGLEHLKGLTALESL